MNHHRPRRREIEWDGSVHVARCRNCDARIEIDRKGRWHRRTDRVA